MTEQEFWLAVLGSSTMGFLFGLWAGIAYVRDWIREKEREPYHGMTFTPVNNDIESKEKRWWEFWK